MKFLFPAPATPKKTAQVELLAHSALHPAKHSSNSREGGNLPCKYFSLLRSLDLGVIAYSAKVDGVFYGCICHGRKHFGSSAYPFKCDDFQESLINSREGGNLP